MLTKIVTVEQWHNRPEALHDAFAYFIYAGQMVTVIYTDFNGMDYKVSIKENADTLFLRKDQPLYIANEDFKIMIAGR